MVASSRRAMSKALDILKPWKWTGPASSAEYQEALPMAGEYRKWAPASAPKELTDQLSVPRRTPERIYDIKYFNRDVRRAGTIAGTRQEVLVVQKCGAKDLPHVPLVAGVPPPPGPSVAYAKRPAFEYENGGYS